MSPMHKPVILLTVALIAGLFATPSVAPVLAEQSAAVGDNVEVTDDPLFQKPQPLDPQQGRSEEEQDRMEASSWFLRGRLAHQREDLPLALRCYQRAWRYDQDAVSILREIVPLAFELKHNATAARYAVIMAEVAPRDSTLLRRLAQHLMDQRDFARALKLYEQAIELRDEDDELDARYVLSQMEIARLYFIEEKYEKSAAAFAIVRDALENPDKYELSDKVHTTLMGNPRVTYTLFGESFLKAGRLEQAAEMFEKAFPDKASAPLLAYHLARIEMANGRPRSAHDQLEKYLASKQTGAGGAAYELLEEVLDELHEEDEADERLRKRLKELHDDDPANAALGYFLADQYRQAERWNEAAELLETTLAAEPTISGYATLIEVYTHQKDADKLLDTLSGAIEQIGSFRPIEEQAEAIVADEELTRRILDIAKKRQEESGEKPNPFTASAAGLLAINAKLFDEADRQLAIAVKADEERAPAIYESWGLSMFIAQEYARAARVFQEAIDKDVAERFNADFYYYLAAALEFDGKTDEALKAAEKAAEENPDSPRYATRYAWVLYHAKRYEEAEREYRKILEKYDDDHSEEDVREVVRETRMVLSNIAIHLDRMPQSEEWLLQVLDEYPEDIGAMNDLGYLWSDQGKHLKRSLRMVQTAVDAEPDNAAYRDSLGWAHFRLGNLDQAIEHLEKAAAQLEETPDGVIMDHLGDAYVAAGRKKDAIKAYQRAIELFEEDEDVEHVQKTQKKLDELRD